MVAKQSQTVAIGCKEVAKPTEVEQLRAQLAQAQAALDKAEQALEWIRKGPTWGPGAPSLEEQVHLQANRAREALAEVRKLREEKS